MNSTSIDHTAPRDQQAATSVAPPALPAEHASMHRHAPDRVDIHRHADKLACDLRRITGDPALLPEHRRAILRFIGDARTGRLPGKASARRLCDGRCLKYIAILRRFALWLKVPFEDVTVEQMQEFILGIERGSITKLVSIGGSTRYSHETVLDFKKMLKRFYSWLIGKSARLGDLTGWFDTREQPPELRTFGLDAVQRLARSIGSPQGQMLVMALFDGGFRAGEFFNLRLSDLRFTTDAEGNQTCLARVRVSKTKARTVSLPLATDSIRFWVERHPGGGAILSGGTIHASNPDAQLCTWS